MIIKAGPLQPPVYVWLDGIDVTDICVRLSGSELELVEAAGWVDILLIDVPASIERRQTTFRRHADGRHVVERRHGRVLWTRKPFGVTFNAPPTATGRAQ